MNKRLKAAIAGLAFVAGCEVGIALQLAKMIREKMIRDYALKEKALSEPLEVSEEDAATEQAFVEESDSAADTEEVSEEDRIPVTGTEDAAFAN